MAKLGEHAVVLGASMGGLLAARVLVDFFRTVTVVERDELSDDPASRRGVPQGRHTHLLLPRGAQIVEELFPGILDELVADGTPVWNDADLSKLHFPSVATKCCGRGRCWRSIRRQWRCTCRVDRFWNAMSGDVCRRYRT